ncbi:MAG TPA: hypothetical protein VN282_03390 [Pyrinomonadaceae bacterium]|nr:hypothetical protein [Pyrinomonadaceae bacterium]
MSKSFRAYVWLALGGLLLCAASSAVSHVAASPDSCPNITISSLQDESEVDRKYSLAANISGGDPARTPTVKWCVSHGKITSGHDTFSVEIDLTGVSEEVVTVTAIVSDLADPACDNVGVHKIKLPKAAGDTPPPPVTR